MLRAAVRLGEVSVRQAEAVLPVAHGEAEATWVARARLEKVRALKAAVKEPAAPEDEEKWTRMRTEVPPELRPGLDEALSLGRRILGATAIKAQLLEAMGEEYLSVHEPPAGVVSADSLIPSPAAELEAIKEWLEKESAEWAFLDQAEPIAAPELDPEADVQSLDAELRRLAAQRERWDEVFGHLAMLFRKLGGWRRLDFASFEHYCTERLGMSVRAVEQRAALEAKLYELPRLRTAMRTGVGQRCLARLRRHARITRLE